MRRCQWETENDTPQRYGQHQVYVYIFYWITWLQLKTWCVEAVGRSDKQSHLYHLWEKKAFFTSRFYARDQNRVPHAAGRISGPQSSTPGSRTRFPAVGCPSRRVRRGPWGCCVWGGWPLYVSFPSSKRWKCPSCWQPSRSSRSPCRPCRCQSGWALRMFGHLHRGWIKVDSVYQKDGSVYLMKNTVIIPALKGFP